LKPVTLFSRIYNAFYCSKKKEIEAGAAGGADVARQESLSDQWFSAVLDNDTTAVVQLLTRGVQVNCRDQCDWSALHTASWNGSTHLTQLLLSSSADPNIQGPGSITPLCLASQQGHVDIVRLLVTAGATVRCEADIDGSQHVTPLHLAVSKGHLQVVKVLVETGADVESVMSVRGVSGVTPLHLAAEAGFLDIIDVLLGAGSNVNTGTQIVATELGSSC
jgi:ankyrin repeat protein